VPHLGWSVTEAAATTRWTTSYNPTSGILSDSEGSFSAAESAATFVSADDGNVKSYYEVCPNRGLLNMQGGIINGLGGKLHREGTKLSMLDPLSDGPAVFAA